MKKHLFTLLTIVISMVFAISACSNNSSNHQSENSIHQTGAPSNPTDEDDSYELENIDHEITEPAPGTSADNGGPQAASDIASVAGVPLVRLNNGVYMPRFGLGTQVQSMENTSQRQQLNETLI